MRDLHSLGAQLATARKEHERLLAEAKGAATTAYSEGVGESEIARRLGVARLTVRRWLGKS